MQTDSKLGSVFLFILQFIIFSNLLILPDKVLNAKIIEFDLLSQEVK